MIFACGYFRFCNFKTHIVAYLRIILVFVFGIDFVCVLFVCGIGSGFWWVSIFVAFSHKDRSHNVLTTKIT